MATLTNSLRVAVNAPPALFPDYERALAAIGVLCTPIRRLMDLTSHPLAGFPFHGMVIDQGMMEGANEGERHILGSLRGIYPVLVTSHHDAPPSRFENFASQLRQAVARPVRSSSREKLTMRAILSPREDMSSPEHTVTLDVSRGGAYIFSANRLPIGYSLWVDFPELEHPRHPIQAQVCWGTSWQATHGPPGFGVKFIKTTPDTARSLQIKLLHSYLPQKRGRA